jgi:MFS family permease
MDNIKSNYLAYVTVYVFISLINIYLLIYFPLYFYDVFKVDRSSLAFTQLISNSMVIFSIILGYLLDEFIKKKKVIISISCVLLYGFFLLFILFRKILLWFGIFLSISLLMRTIVKTGMIKLMFELVKSNETIKKNIVLISNVSASIGSLIPTFIFSTIVIDLYSLPQWNSFFILGWVISFPIIFAFFLIKEVEAKDNTNPGGTIKDKSSANPINLVKNDFSPLIFMLLIYISYFLLWSNNLFGYPLSSWVMNKFGENGFRWFSIMYIVFFICNMSGFFLAKQLHKKGNEKQIIMIGILIIFFLFLTFPIAIFPIFVLLYTIDSLLYGVVCSNYVYLIIDISRKGKYENLKYQVMQSSAVLANIIFTSMGIILSSFLSTDFLMIISAFLVLIGLVPLIIKYNWKFSI